MSFPARNTLPARLLVWSVSAILDIDPGSRASLSTTFVKFSSVVQAGSTTGTFRAPDCRKVDAGTGWVYLMQQL